MKVIGWNPTKRKRYLLSSSVILNMGHGTHTHNLRMSLNDEFLSDRQRCSVSLLAVCTPFGSVTSGLRRPAVDLLRGSRSYFRSECSTDGESMTARRVNRLLVPNHLPINAENEAGQAAITVFQIFGMTRLGIEPCLPALMAHVQPIVPLIQ